MALVNLVADLCVERMREKLSKPSREVIAASAGPALANAALLMAHGCPVRYVTALQSLYSTNNLPCPNLDGLFDLELPSPSTEKTQVTREAECQTTEASTTSMGMHRVSKTSVSVQTEPRYNKDLRNTGEYRETQQLDDILRAVEEIPASLDEIDELLMFIKTAKDLPSTYKKADDLDLDYDENYSYVGLEDHPIKFNGDFYALQGPDQSDTDDWYTSPSSDWEDWFDEDLDIHCITAPLTRNGSMTTTGDSGCNSDYLARTAPCIHFTTPKNSKKFKTGSTPAFSLKIRRRRNSRLRTNQTSTKSTTTDNCSSSSNGSSTVTSSQLFRLNPIGKKTQAACPGTPMTSTYKPRHTPGNNYLADTLNYLCTPLDPSPIAGSESLIRQQRLHTRHYVKSSPLEHGTRKHSLTRRLY